MPSLSFQFKGSFTLQYALLTKQHRYLGSPHFSTSQMTGNYCANHIENCMLKELKYGRQVQINFVLLSEMANIFECHLSCQSMNHIMSITGIQQGTQSKRP